MGVWGWGRGVVEATVIFAVPSNDTPFMVRAVSSAVAVDAFPTRAAFTVVNHAVVPESKVVVAFAKVLSPVHVLLLAKSVLEAAVTVIESPRLKAVLLIVPKEPLMNPAPIVVVETTSPF